MICFFCDSEKVENKAKQSKSRWKRLSEWAEAEEEEEERWVHVQCMTHNNEEEMWIRISKKNKIREKSTGRLVNHFLLTVQRKPETEREKKNGWANWSNPPILLAFYLLLLLLWLSVTGSIAHSKNYVSPLSNFQTVLYSPVHPIHKSI